MTYVWLIFAWFFTVFFSLLTVSMLLIGGERTSIYNSPEKVNIQASKIL
jgi:hypothetical protein